MVATTESITLECGQEITCASFGNKDIVLIIRLDYEGGLLWNCKTTLTLEEAVTFKNKLEQVIEIEKGKSE